MFVLNWKHYEFEDNNGSALSILMSKAFLVLFFFSYYPACACLIITVPHCDSAIHLTSLP